jgi:hypothetical protein
MKSVDYDVLLIYRLTRRMLIHWPRLTGHGWRRAMETNAEYHADKTHVGASMLKDFAESPALYHGRYVTGEIPRKPPTPALVLGSLTHCLLLEPEKFDDLYIVAPGCKTRQGKKWTTIAELAEAEGKTPILPDMVTAAKAMVAKVKDHPQIRKLNLLEMDVRCEQPCKPDMLVADKGFAWVVDIDFKTSKDPRRIPWGVDAAKFRYLAAAAFYRDVVLAQDFCEGRPYKRLWLVLGTEPPHDVYIREASTEQLNAAEF